MKAFAALSLAALAFSASAQPAADAEQAQRSAERLRITEERARIEEAFTLEEIACYDKFFVNACLNKMKPRRREALADLRRQEILLDEAERKFRGAEQIRKIEEKSSQERRDAEAAQRQQALEDFNARTERAEQKRIERSELERGLPARAAETTEKIQNNQAKRDAHAQKEAEAAANAENFRLRQEEARKRSAEYEQSGAAQPSRKPLPVPQ